MKEAKNNKKIGHKLEKSFLQKILGFRFTPSISAWKLAIALFMLMTIAYAVNGAGIIAKGDSLEVSGNATVQGKVGIGTTAPEFLLNVVSSGIALPVEISASNSGTGNSFGLLRLWRLSSTVNDQAGIIFSLQDSQPARQEYGYIAAKISSSTSGSEAGDLLFSTTNLGALRQERMRITSAGNVGINTTTPTEKLDVNGRVKGTELCIGADCRNAWPAGGAGGGGGWVDDGTAVRLETSTDKVGIGTTAPARKLHIKDSAADNVLVVDSGDGITQRFSAVDLHDNGAAKWGIGKNPSGDFYIDQSGVGNAITVLGSNRNVGIGTTSPDAPLVVSGDPVIGLYQTTGTNQRKYQLFSTSSGNSDAGGGKFAVRDAGVAGPAGYRFVIDQNGNVGIGTTGPSGKLGIASGSGFEIYGHDAAQTFNIFSQGDMNLLADTGKTLNFGSNNVNSQMVINGGNVGIGRSSGIQGTLHVNYPFANTDTTERTVATWSSNEASGYNQLYMTAKGAATQADRVWRLQTSLGGTGDAGILALQSGGGNVGIGTTTPTQKLDVAGQIHATGDVCTDVGGGKCLSTAGAGDTTPDTIADDNVITLGTETSGTYDATSDTIADDGVISDAEASDVLTIDNGLLYAPTSGNVGIGTTTPDSSLELSGSSAAISLNENSATPSTPATGTEARIYMKADRLIIQYRDGTTTRYKSLLLTGTGSSWSHSLTAP